MELPTGLFGALEHVAFPWPPLGPVDDDQALPSEIDRTRFGYIPNDRI